MIMELELRSSLSTEDDAEDWDISQRSEMANATLTITISSGVSWGLTLQAEFRVATDHGRTIAQSADCEQAFSVINSWMDSCINDHQMQCADASHPPLLPTRVIDVSPVGLDVGLVCLRDDQNKVDRAARYVALSHCWGKCIPFATTTENLEDRKREVRIEDMSQVFQEAVLITRQLGIRYLWIDTLCIVQNDRHDWEVEAGRMAKVYMDAFVVLGASNSNADDQGFLGPRAHPGSINWTKTLHNGRTSCLALSLLPPAGERWTSGRDPVSSEPLQSRAWCLQERYLAQRILLYGARQLFWECRAISRAEDGDLRPGNLHNLDRLKGTASNERTIFGPRPDDYSEVNYRGWYEMIEEYTQRSITHQSDRFPALSGVANAIAQTSRDVYLAGLWRKGLVEGLLWCAMNRDEPLKKPTSYRAPSWSWASAEGPVQFIVYHFIERCRWKRGIADYEQLATFVDCDVKKDGPDLYGTVSGGYLRLHAPLLPVKNLYPADDRPPLSELLLPPLRNSTVDQVVEMEVGKESFYLHAGFDMTLEPVLPQHELFVLFLARLPDGNHGFSPFMDHRFGLLVRRTDKDSDVYERVGIIDSPILTKDTSGGALMTVLRLLEKSHRFLERFSPSVGKMPVFNLTPRLFVPKRVLAEEPEEEMPPDPLPEIKQHSVSVTLV
ncbi:heterokaryon incompatibility protein-domain-containing protein [Aspergillus caelatus]|uniref:Heterokaryon incompatibility protein-domain-containing protein n=1 Tax=Aspergillus caelatus TaxID=61420 RepID=A0A5N6ZQ20_9EURO|nr:heterokaryon incompatibility protein-domain-containing protein [Aspergillus caelatus]KAE8359478.1 heterokaryon incompatibility protein-domain-containing protein [Aspergillus caelatus]